MVFGLGFKVGGGGRASVSGYTGTLVHMSKRFRNSWAGPAVLIASISASLPAVIFSQGLADVARHIIQRTLKPSFLG